MLAAAAGAGMLALLFAVPGLVPGRSLASAEAFTVRPTDQSGTTADASTAAERPPTTPIPTPPPTAPPTPPPTPAPPPRPAMAALGAGVQPVLASAGGSVAVAVVELGPGGQSWSTNADSAFIAASTYKLPVLMWEAQGLAAGTLHAQDVLCYEEADWEDGYFADYGPGSCLTRQELAVRVGRYSDNTAAHILVREMGGAAALNGYAAAHGARESTFFAGDNTTTASDLARLLADEAAGRAGGAAAQAWLYPILTHTEWEDGVPAGVPAPATVTHKVGMLGGEVNDAALVQPAGRPGYIVVVLSDGAGHDGWDTVASVSAAVWTFEVARRG